jgi:type IX secretion system PorP/SprF family membrane protein
MRSIILGVIILFSVKVIAQQEQQYTQFMYNKLSINPGYAGSTDAGCFSAIYRKQWIGLEGAPETQLLSFNTPLLNRRVGVGLTILRHSIGIENRISLEGSYSYRIQVGRGTLGLGIMPSIRRRTVDWNDSRLKGTQPIGVDGAIAGGFQSKWLFNVGVGAYYSTNKYYVGVSLPRILKNNIDFSEVGSIISKEVHHAYLMTGLLVNVNDKIKLQPQILVKYAQNSPLDFDLNLMGIFMEKFNAGLTYRAGGSKETGIGESLDVLVGAQLTRNLMFGLSYDITLSEVKNYSNGSIEAILRYCLGKSEGKEYINPRFF